MNSKMSLVMLITLLAVTLAVVGSLTIYKLAIHAVSESEGRIVTVYPIVPYLTAFFTLAAIYFAAKSKGRLRVLMLTVGTISVALYGLGLRHLDFSVAAAEITEHWFLFPVSTVSLPDLESANYCYTVSTFQVEIKRGSPPQSIVRYFRGVLPSSFSEESVREGFAIIGLCPD